MAKASGNKDVAPFSIFVNKAKNCDVKQITTFHPVYENRSDDVSSPNLDQECLKIGSLNPSKPLIKIFFQDVRPVKLVDLSLPEVKTGDVSVHCSRAGNCQQSATTKLLNSHRHYLFVCLFVTWWWTCQPAPPSGLGFPLNPLSRLSWRHHWLSSPPYYPPTLTIYNRLRTP